MQLKKNSTFRYHKEKLKENECSDQIEKDLRRTLIPGHLQKHQKLLFYAGMRNVLIAYSNFNSEIGYAQGMNIIVACILYNRTLTDLERLYEKEESCFWLFVSLLENYNIKTCFFNKMQKIFDLSNYLDYSLKNELEDVYDIINCDNVR